MLLWALCLAVAEPERPADVPEGSCFGAGVWTPSGSRGPLPDRCNQGLCTDGRWVSTTLAKCEVAIKERLYFPSDEASVREVQKPILDAIARVLLDHPEHRFRIEGHRLPGEPERLDVLRAEAVRDALVARGVPASQVPAVGLGSGLPLAGPENPDADARNRRVEFAWIDPAEP